METRKQYRKGIIVVIINDKKEFLLVHLPQYPEGHWNFIGNGRKEHENAGELLKNTLFRKLNIAATDFELSKIAATPFQYDFPELRVKDDGKLYAGQVKEPYLVRFTGQSDQIKPLAGKVAEHKWVAFSELPKYLLFPGQYKETITMLKELLPNEFSY